jgi:hypothetical protein
MMCRSTWRRRSQI